MAIIDRKEFTYLVESNSPAVEALMRNHFSITIANAQKIDALHRYNFFGLVYIIESTTSFTVYVEDANEFQKLQMYFEIPKKQNFLDKEL